MNKNALITVVIVIIVAGAAFFGGMKYQQSKVSANSFGQGGRGQFFSRFNGNGQRGNANGRPVVGKVVSQDANSITVQLQDGSSMIVNVAGSTTFSKTDTASKTDVKTGDNIAAFGTTNSDGSITAQNIQLNPMFQFRGGPRPTQAQ